MTELPKSVREQLARGPLPTQHPDADLLTAYGENSLSGTERQSVMEHLAMCEECREVVFLALPEGDSAQEAVSPAPVRKVRWMAWASAAAAVVVVGSAVVVFKPGKSPAPPEPVSIAQKEAPAQPNVEVPREAAKPQVPSDASRPAKTRTSDQVAGVKPTPSPVPSIAIPTREEPAIAEQKKDDAVAARDLAKNEVGQNSAAGVVAGKIASSGPASTVNANVTNVYTASNTAPPAATPKAKAEMARKAAVPATAYGYDARLAQTVQGRAHWRISNDGILERSYVADSWEPVLTNTGVRFRVLSVIGDLLWAGGDHGSLFVSRNSGQSWDPVKLDSTADVISIHFDDEMNGTVRTSDSKTWKTSDGGTHWTVVAY